MNIYSLSISELEALKAKIVSTASALEANNETLLANSTRDKLRAINTRLQYLVHDKHIFDRV